jgi:hypothetical protein
MPPVSNACVIENHVGARDESHQGLVGSQLVIAWRYCTLSRCDGTALFLRWGLPVGHGVLERTVALAEQTGGFGARQLRAVLDSTPLFGAGRVEDTLNLLGHALRKAVGLAAQELGTSAEAVVEATGLTLVGHSSLKAALDPDWGSPARGNAPWDWCWRRWHGGNTGWSSSRPWLPSTRI